MNNSWKLATIGIALMGVTASTAGLTTAYLLRPTATAGEQFAPVSGPPTLGPRHAMAPVVPMHVPTPISAPAPLRVASAPPPVLTTPVDCSTGSDRALKVAKPGVLGTLLGAGLGAAGGAIADGGEGAGKGALIGGIAGAAIGTGYGAYKTKSECGTIFGGERAATVSASPSMRSSDRPTAWSEVPQAALR